MATRSSNIHARYDDSEGGDFLMEDDRNRSYERCLSPECFQGHSFPPSISWIDFNSKLRHEPSNWVWKCDKHPDPVAEDSPFNIAEGLCEPSDRQTLLSLAGVERSSESRSSAQQSIPAFISIEQPRTLRPSDALSHPSSIKAPFSSCSPRYSRQRSPSPFRQPYGSSCRRSNSRSLSPHRFTPRAPRRRSPVLRQEGDIRHGQRAIEVQDHFGQERRRSRSPIHPPLPPAESSTRLLGGYPAPSDAATSRSMIGSTNKIPLKDWSARRRSGGGQPKASHPPLAPSIVPAPTPIDLEREQAGGCLSVSRPSVEELGSNTAGSTLPVVGMAPLADQAPADPLVLFGKEEGARLSDLPAALPMEVQESNEERLPPPPAPTSGPLPMEVQESSEERLPPRAIPLSTLGVALPAADQAPTPPAPTSGRAARAGLSRRQWRKMQAAGKGRGSTEDNHGPRPGKGRKGRAERLLEEMESRIAATVRQEVHKIFDLATVSSSEPGQSSSGPSSISQEGDAKHTLGTSASSGSSSEGIDNSTLLQELQRLLQGGPPGDS